jgi:hypothetical protein
MHRAIPTFAEFENQGLGPSELGKWHKALQGMEKEGTTMPKSSNIIEVKDLPLVVTMDSHGQSLHEAVAPPENGHHDHQIQRKSDNAELREHPEQVVVLGKAMMGTPPLLREAP